MTAIKKLFLHFFGKSDNSVWENIYLCACISFACGIFGYATAKGNMTILNTVFGNLLFMATWCYSSFVSGLKRQWGFLVFGGLYYIIPGVYMAYYASRDNLVNYNAGLAVLNRISDLFFNKPLERISQALDSPIVVINVCFAIVVISVFFIGLSIAYLRTIKVLGAPAKSHEEEDEEEYRDLTGQMDVDYILSEIDGKKAEAAKAAKTDSGKSAQQEYTTELLFSDIKKAAGATATDKSYGSDTKPADKTYDTEDKSSDKTYSSDAGPVEKEEPPEGYEDIFRSIMEEKKKKSK